MMARSGVYAFRVDTEEEWVARPADLPPYRPPQQPPRQWARLHVEQVMPLLERFGRICVELCFWLFVNVCGLSGEASCI